MADAVATLIKNLTDIHEETLEFFTSIRYAESAEEKVAEAKLINHTLADKKR